jgi:hypothetical protein
MLKSEIERTTTDDVIRIGTSQVKLGKEFGGLNMEKRRVTRLLIPSICNKIVSSRSYSHSKV